MAIFGNNTPSTVYKTVRSTAQAMKIIPPESGLVYSVTMYCASDSTGVPPTWGIDLGCQIYNSNRVFVSNFSSIEMRTGDVWSWRTAPYYTGPISVIGGQTYYVFISGGSVSTSYKIRVGYIAGSPNSSNIVLSPYNPRIPNPLTESNLFCIYFTYTPTTPPGPALKIEGITPGKLEGTSWSNISTVR